MEPTTNPPERTVYSKTYRGREGSTFIPGQQELAYPFVLILNAAGIVVVLALLPALPPPVNVIAGGATAGWVVASLWMIYREAWKKRKRSEHLVVNPSTQELRRVFIYRSGEQNIQRYSRDQMHALIPHQDENRYSVMLDAEWPWRSRWELADFKTAAERDALQLPIKAEKQAQPAPDDGGRR